MIKFPDYAPLDDAQKSQLAALVGAMDDRQITWVSGFLAGCQGGASAAPAAATDRKLTVLYGTESGNSEQLADQLFKSAKQKGFKSSLINMSESTPADLKDVGTLLVVVSTWGEGDPPEAAEDFYQQLMAGGVSLEGVEFSVCALGDTSYDQFCQTGKEVDAQLEKLGAVRVADRVDCDVDFDDSFAAWKQDVWSKLGGAASAQDESSAYSAAANELPVYDKKNPFPSEILENQLLSGALSGKETHHVEISLEGSGLTYEPGDVLAVLPRNAEDVVDSILNATGLAADTEVEVKGVGRHALSTALTVDLDITGLSRKVANAWQEVSGSDALAKLLDDSSKEAYKTWSDGRQIVDLLEAYPAKEVTAQQLVDVLRKLPLRLYSIASSPKAHPGEVHLTVSVVRYDTHDKSRKGVASTFLADDAPKGAKVSVYIHHNKNFRLPENADTPIIMVGPGTGIAPFRAFIEDRDAAGVTGDSWLFFGDQRYNEDFLYQLEWQDYLKKGSLSRIDVAFSRDQPEKVYVQDKMEEHAAELWQWLEKGGHIYVCGDASRMAKCVHETLRDVIISQGGQSTEEAEAYLSNMKKEKRYQRDVY
ncbi:MAG: assimilatory sulfite reductase (NADPH) flavoprotein subunit [Verrucomicrobiae bacterium]|nr:assimilatory sulfite reductase (NADPH) flavoprotein subunit [Verrucomicrobiae bacterium]NNJ41996.1 assimilatory sulfite reductase (NADPH) flavoprotein subunit [Akkermansiaceae bacterium]